MSIEKFTDLTFRLTIVYCDSHLTPRAANGKMYSLIYFKDTLEWYSFTLQLPINDLMYTRQFSIDGNTAIQLNIAPITTKGPSFNLYNTDTVVPEYLHPKIKKRIHAAMTGQFQCIEVNELNSGPHILLCASAKREIISRIELMLPKIYCDEWFIRYNKYMAQLKQ